MCYSHTQTVHTEFTHAIPISCWLACPEFWGENEGSMALLWWTSPRAHANYYISWKDMHGTWLYPLPIYCYVFRTLWGQVEQVFQKISVFYYNYTWALSYCDVYCCSAYLLLCAPFFLLAQQGSAEIAGIVHAVHYTELRHCKIGQLTNQKPSLIPPILYNKNVNDTWHHFNQSQLLK